MSLWDRIERSSEVQGMFGQTFPCQINHEGQSILVIIDCGRPCVDVSHPYIQKLLIEDPKKLIDFLATVIGKAACDEREWLERLSDRRGILRDVKPRGLSGHIYLLKGENGRYKIGRTLNLASRVKNLQASSPVSIDLVHSFRSANTRVVERLLHDRFAMSRKHGEWFNLLPADLLFIQGLVDFQLDGETNGA